jgi:hypothetical protein
MYELHVRQSLTLYLHLCRFSDPKQIGILYDHKNAPWQRRGTNSFKTTMCLLFSRRRAVHNLLSRGRKSSSGRRRSTNASGRGYTIRRSTTRPRAGCLNICGTSFSERTLYSKLATVLKEYMWLIVFVVVQRRNSAMRINTERVRCWYTSSRTRRREDDPPLLGPIHRFPIASGPCPASSLWLLQEHSTMLCTASIKRVECTVVCNMHTQQFISHICYLAHLGRKSLRVEVEYISEHRLLFSCSELMSGVASI